MTKKLSHTVLKQAADWYACVMDEHCSPADYQAWQDWLNQHDSHQQAWQQIQQITQSFQQLKNGQDQQKNIISSILMTPSISRRQLLSIAVLGSFGGSIAYSQREQLQFAMQVARSDAHSRFAARQQVSLSHGAQLWLNTQTAVQYVDANTLHLLSGEILLVARAGQSLQVLHEFGRIQLQDAQCCIRLFATHAQVGVLHGEAQLYTSSGQLYALKAGQQIQVGVDQLSKAQTLQTFAYSWIRGVLAADSMTMAQWVAEMQRYHHCHVNCSAQVATLRVVGLFPLDDLSTALRMLAQVLPVKISQRFHYWINIDQSI